jgi:hypothetical protein
MNHPEVSVIILNWNNKKVIEELIIFIKERSNAEIGIVESDHWAARAESNQVTPVA